MSALRAAFYAANGEAKGKVDLPDAIFGDAGSRYSLQETIIGLQRNQRRGTSETKTRGNVRGGGRKPWKQKGTGNARAGSIRSPLWRGGGIIFGPHPRSYRVDLPEAKRAVALKTALVVKVKAGELSIIESIAFPQTKTSSASQFFKKTGIAGHVLLVVDKMPAEMTRALRNLHGFTWIAASDVNAWNLLAVRQVLVTNAALDILAQRFSKN